MGRALVLLHFFARNFPSGRFPMFRKVGEEFNDLESPDSEARETEKLFPESHSHVMVFLS